MHYPKRLSLRECHKFVRSYFILNNWANPSARPYKYLTKATSSQFYPT
ncbi:hypothetical protein MHA_2229 [Mannheimia haemolytica PHL213]|nr:hypothetical protein MHA_2229 [Mannheimia haemolytica PHL213]